MPRRSSTRGSQSIQVSWGGVLVINPLIYAEFGAFAGSLEELDELLTVRDPGDADL